MRTKEQQMRIDLMKRIFWNRTVTETPLAVMCDECDQSKPKIVVDTDGFITGTKGASFELHPLHSWVYDTDGEVVILTADDIEEGARVLQRMFLMLPCPFEGNCSECPAQKVFNHINLNAHE